jgi:hypothetical protein
MVQFYSGRNTNKASEQTKELEKAERKSAGAEEKAADNLLK